MLLVTMATAFMKEEYFAIRYSDIPSVLEEEKAKILH